MNSLTKTIITIISGLIIAVTGILVYVYWPAITGTVTDNKYLTSEQGQELYDKGFSDGCKSEEELLAQVAYYKELTDEYYVQVNSLNSEINSLNSSIASKNTSIDELNDTISDKTATIASLNNVVAVNRVSINDLNSQIDSLTNSKSSLELRVTELNNSIQVKQNSINELNSQITYLQSNATNSSNEISSLNSQIATLQTQLQNDSNDKVALQNTITTLNNQIVNLNALKTQLEQTNASNTLTITSLNNQIVSLNSQISSLNSQILAGVNTIANLNNRITELQDSITYYENFIATFESDNQAIVTFEFDGSLYNMQLVEKGTYVSVTNPTSTEYVVFNGWKLNNTSVNLSTFVVNANCNFVADVTYKHKVTFKVDTAVYDTEMVVDGSYSTAPTTPTKTGYVFSGWTLDGTTVVNLNSVAISNDTTFIAKFTKLHTVTFIYEGTTYSTVSVENSNLVTAPTIANTTYKIFNGWKLNGAFVDLDTYIITADTTFTADITYKYDVVFKVDGSVYNSQIITKNNYASLPNNPTKTGYTFAGWTSNGTTIVDVASQQINSNTEFIAKFNINKYTVTFMVDNASYSTSSIDYNSYPTVPSNPSKTGYTFAGWTTDGTNIIDVSTIVVTEEKIFYAKFTINTYVVTFVANEQTYATQNVTYNNYVILPQNPTKDGFDFSGWTLNNNVVDLTAYPITASVTFTAKFEVSSGLFNDEGVMTMSWNEMIEDNYITFADGVVGVGSNTDKTALIGTLKMPNTVTSISDGTTSSSPFGKCTGLTKIILPNSLTKIGNYGFYGCTGLTDVYFGDSSLTIGTYAFSGCNAITGCYITNMDKWCQSLLTDYYSNPMYFAKSFYYLDNDNWVNGTETFTLNSSIVTNAKYLFTNIPFQNLTITNASSNGTANIFYYCNKTLQTLKFDNFDLWIKYYADNSSFNLNYYLHDLTINNKKISEINESEFYSMVANINYIPSYTFYNCNNITSLSIPSNIIKLNSNSLNSFNNLTTLVVPSTVTSINSGAILAPNLVNIKLPFVGTSASVSSSTTSAVFGVIFGYSADITTTKQYYAKSKTTAKYIPATLRNVTITGGKIFGYGAFSGCSNLEYISVPETITKISDYAFYACYSLKQLYFNAANCASPESGTAYMGIGSHNTDGCTIVIGNKVQVINYKMFMGTNFSLDESKLHFTHVYFEEGSICTTIYGLAFQYCYYLKDVYIPSSVTTFCYEYMSDTVIGINNYCFSLVMYCPSSCKIYIQASSKPSGYGNNFNYVDSSTGCSVVYGYSLSAYKSAAGVA